MNVEVPCPARDVPALTLFVRALRAACAAEAAAAVPPIPYTPIVLWYDAVTVDGALAWQDGLTPANAAFFDVADGILTNYCWTTRKLAQSIALAGPARSADVWAGEDAWGRGSYGGVGEILGVLYEGDIVRVEKKSDFFV